MSLVTRCPRCRTLFRVLPAQLEAHAGTVRCGRCMHVFDGLSMLAVERPRALAETARAASGNAPENPAPRPLQDSPPTDADADVPADVATLRAPRAAALGVAACVVLASLLAVQVAYLFRSELAARYPAARTAFTSVCTLFACTLALPQRTDLVKIEASDVHMLDRPGLIQLTATLRSYADYDVAYPALDLVLTNATEHALARRIFLPGEYLGGTRDPKAGLPPRAEITIALDLDTDNLNAAGFRLDLLAAPAP